MLLNKNANHAHSDLLRLSLLESELENCFEPKPIDMLVLPCAAAVSFASIALAAANALGLFESGLLVLSTFLGAVVVWIAALTRSLSRFRILQELVWRGLTNHGR
jgi:hypothetical protein